jgi:Trp operon repressor
MNIQFVELVKQRLSAKDIGNQLNVSPATICIWSKKLGFKSLNEMRYKYTGKYHTYKMINTTRQMGLKCKGRRKLILNFDILNKLLKDNKTQEEVCKFFKVSNPTLFHCIKRETGLGFLQYRKKVCGGCIRGKNHPSSKLKGIPKSEESKQKHRNTLFKRRLIYVPKIKELLDNGFIMNKIAEIMKLGY